MTGKVLRQSLRRDGPNDALKIRFSKTTTYCISFSKKVRTVFKRIYNFPSVSKVVYAEF